MAGKKDKLNPELKRLSEFHGHLGPYAVVGLRMGKLARKKFGNIGKKLTAEVYTGLKPPMSCLIDGIQVASGCTMGKGNITVIDKKKPLAVFTAPSGSLRLELKKKVKEEIEATMRHDNEVERSLWIYKMKVGDLFAIAEN